MKLEYFDGCTNSSLTINGEEVIDFSEKDIETKLKPILKQLIDQEKDLSVLQDIFIEFLETRGKCTDYEICETCGDSSFSYELNLAPDNRPYIKDKILEAAQKYIEGGLLAAEGANGSNLKEIKDGEEMSKEALEEIVDRTYDYESFEDGLLSDFNFNDYRMD